MAMTMKAIQVQAPGGPEVLTQVELPVPACGPGQVRVRARAIGAGGPDVLIRKGIYKWMPPMPAIPGNEMAGVIEAVGEGVPADRVGQRVFVSARELPQRGGCYAEYIVVPADAPFALPDAISDTEAVSLGNVQLAQAMLLGTQGGVPVRSILVPGAAGGVATALTQLAAHHGMTVIGTASTPAKQAHALAHGVTVLVDGDPEGLPERVMAATGGRGVDLAFDHVGDRLLIACIRALAPMGTAISYNIAAGPPAEDVFQTLRSLLSRSLAVRTFSIHSFDVDRTQRRALMETAISLMRDGAVRASPATTYALSQAREVHVLLDAGAVQGKLVLVP
ncbi:Quinone oxidoreductase 1 [Variovorax sp. PBS-H4]|uniref:zinc-dependent alcohol dehydrogenase family protein n=1 Tax=Variovorax sp. PBS-H4 TaxID=434008 RepID=UPI00131613A6|nr:zinc-dependent alcohol dehydrogenase family protein [Variovorax sp. PBS-H4]VTU39093.1 Quinone oxidoreductase 1 [Variovorax sp. PBS-H4]